MKTNNQNYIAGLAISIAAVFVVTAFSAVFSNHVDAQEPLTSPREACQYYQDRWERGLLAVKKDEEDECLVRVGDNNTGFGYIRSYYSGNKFCMDSYGAYFNNAGLSDSSECIPVSRPGGEQQNILDVLDIPLPLVAGGVILGLVVAFLKRKQIFHPQEKKRA